MPKYRLIPPPAVEAIQWQQPGDHPTVVADLETGKHILPVEGGHFEISPGDWIVSGLDDRHWMFTPDEFAALFEPVHESE